MLHECCNVCEEINVASPAELRAPSEVKNHNGDDTEAATTPRRRRDRNGYDMQATKPKRRRNRRGDETETATPRRRRNRNGDETETAKKSRWRRNKSGGETQITTKRAATRSTVTKPKRRRRRLTLAIIFNLKFGSNGNDFRAQIWNHFPSSNLEPFSVPNAEPISVPGIGSHV